ncbi:hypothetical protein EI94DRAFT_1742890 [Lactarius quietus]|nr:hypothetical protein EI94DRAFT_1742890 [Lactarius quietus]
MSSPPEDTLMDWPPPLLPDSTDRAAGRDGAKLKWSPPGKVELSVFDILNIFHCHWFLSRANLLANAISAQKAEDGNISWVKFTPQYHSHLVKCAVALVPHPVLTVKKVMFVYILGLLNRKGNPAFFNLQVGGRKANNAQKEKRCLAQKRSHAAKREWDHEVAKAAKLPTCERQCMACGQKFKSRKTASKHKCPKSKVVHMGKEAASRQASQALPAAKPDKPPATLTPHAPTAPSNKDALPAVTGASQENTEYLWIVAIASGLRRQIHRDEAPGYRATGLWRPE